MQADTPSVNQGTGMVQGDPPSNSLHNASKGADYCAGARSEQIPSCLMSNASVCLLPMSQHNSAVVQGLLTICRDRLYNVTGAFAHKLHQQPAVTHSVTHSLWCSLPSAVGQHLPPPSHAQ